MTVTRRQVLKSAPLAATGALAASASSEAAAEELPEPIRSLRPLTDGTRAIEPAEHRARVERARELMAAAGIDALVVGPGSGLSYYTGVSWRLSERFFGVVIPREGVPVWVTPAFEKGRALEGLPAGDDVRAWEEDASPYALVGRILKDRGVATGRIGIEERLPFVFSNGIAQAVPAARLTDATPVTAGGRMIKDPHELALMRRAAEITRRAHRAVFASLREGTTVEQARAWCTAAHRQLGVRGGALVLFGADAAFPHGTAAPRPLREGDVVLIDGGGRLHGYASDITRTGVFAARPTDRQRRVWDVVRAAQKAAFEATRPGVECQAVDAAARRVIAEAGFDPGYGHLTHRLGHGIGLDGHEWPYMVRGNTTRLQPGMTFTDEPGIYLPGELGVRHEDTLAVTGDGAENLGGSWTGPPEDPATP